MAAAPSLPARARGLWHIQRVKRLVRDQMGPGAQGMVSVQETLCTDPACPGPATHVRIVMITFQEICGVIHKPPAEVSAADVCAMLAGAPAAPAPPGERG